MQVPPFSTLSNLEAQKQENLRNAKIVKKNFINACRNGDLEKITSLVANPILKAYHIEEGLEYVSLLDSLEAVKIILNQHPNTNTDGAIFNAQRAQSANVNAYFYELESKKLQHSKVFLEACKAGLIDKVKSLLADPIGDPSYNSNSALLSACSSGHLEVVKILVNDSRIDPSFPSNKPLHEACQNGHVEIVKLLLENKEVDFSYMTGPYSLLIAAFEHIEVIKVLLQDSRINLAANADFVIRAACKKGNIEVLKVLLQDSRVYSALNYEKPFATLQDKCTEITDLLSEARFKAALKK